MTEQRNTLLYSVPSVIEALNCAERWESASGERRMVAALMRWLLGARWIGSASRVAFEVPCRGRRIDLVTVSGKGRLAAFEFKLGGTGRAFEQALYNSASVHRSFVVFGSEPTTAYRNLARDHGLGIFVVNGSVRMLERSVPHSPPKLLSAALRDRTLQKERTGV
jgi:hypothetical protein